MGSSISRCAPFLLILLFCSCVGGDSASNNSDDLEQVEVVVADGHKLVKCFWLERNEGYLKEIISEDFVDSPILGVYDRIGSRFLIDSTPHGMCPLWLELKQNRKRIVYDSTQDKGFDHRILVTYLGQNEKGESQLKVQFCEDSEFLLRKSVQVNVPEGGTFLLKSASSEQEGKAHFLWVQVGKKADCSLAMIPVGTDPDFSW